MSFFTTRITVSAHHDCSVTDVLGISEGGTYRVISCGDDDTLHRMTPLGEEPLNYMGWGGDGHPREMAASNSTLYVADSIGEVTGIEPDGRMYDLEGNEDVPNPVTGLCPLSTDCIAIISPNATVELWNHTLSGEYLAELGYGVKALTLLPNGHLVTASQGPELPDLSVWDYTTVESPVKIRTIVPNKVATQIVALSDGLIAAVHEGDNQGIYLYRLEEDNEIPRLLAVSLNPTVRPLAIDRARRRLVAATKNGRFTMFNLDDLAQEPEVFSLNQGIQISCIKFMPDGALAIGDQTGNVHLLRD